MSGFGIALGVVGVVVALAVVYAVSVYNTLVALRARFRNAFAQIEVQLTRRYDLIPNIVETAKGYMKHEQETLNRVVEARNEALSVLKSAMEHPESPALIEALSGAEQKLTGAMGGLKIQVEAYPELKADGLMQQLTEELTSTENRVAFARQGFNDAATAYNIYRQSFPANLLAGPFGHTQNASLLTFENSEEIQKAPKVAF